MKPLGEIIAYKNGAGAETPKANQRRAFDNVHYRVQL